MATHLSGRRVILTSLCLVAIDFLSACASNDKDASVGITAMWVSDVESLFDSLNFIDQPSSDRSIT